MQPLTLSSVPYIKETLQGQVLKNKSGPYLIPILQTTVESPPKWRVRFDKLKKDKRFEIIVLQDTYHNRLKYGQYSVRVNFGKNTLLLNKNSLSQRMLFSPEELSESVRKGTVEKIINERIRDFANCMHQYEPIVHHYKMRLDGSLESNYLTENINLYASTLFKAIKAANTKGSNKRLIIKKKGLIYQVDGKWFLAKRDEHNEHKQLHIFLLSKNDCEKIGEGGFAFVFKALEITSGKFVAFKVANVQGFTRAGKNIIRESIKREFNILQAINKEGESRNIQGKPITFVKTESPYKVYGFFGPLYQGTLIDWLYDDYNNQTRLRCCKQLAIGLKLLFDRAYCHRDIKPDNILYEYSAGRYAWKFGDFGAAENIHPSRFEPPLEERTTYEYVLANESSALLKCAKVYLASQSAIHKEATRLKYVRIAQQIDIYSLGTTFCMVLTGGLRPYIENNNKPYPRYGFRCWPDLRAAHYSRKIINVVLGMIEPNPAKRYSIDQVIQGLAHIE